MANTQISEGTLVRFTDGQTGVVSHVSQRRVIVKRTSRRGSWSTYDIPRRELTFNVNDESKVVSILVPFPGQ